MKLSEMDTAQLFSTLGNILPYMMNFIDDDNIKKFFADRKKRILKGSKASSSNMRLAVEIAGVALKERQLDSIGIIAAIEGCPLDKISKQNGMKTLSQAIKIIFDVLNNEILLSELTDFFPQPEQSVQEQQ